MTPMLGSTHDRANAAWAIAKAADMNASIELLLPADRLYRGRARPGTSE